MFNVAVINLKDILKYLVSLTAVILIVMLLTRFFYDTKNNQKIKDQLNIKIQSVSENSLLVALNKTIPAIEETNEELNKISREDEKLSESILEKMLSIELGYIDTQEAIKEGVKNEETQLGEQNNNTNNEIQLAGTNLQTEVVTQNPLSNKYTNEYNGVQIKNETSYELTGEMLAPNIEVNNSNIIIFHTHTCESYTSSEKYSYTPTGTYRTTDLSYSVAKVGDELTNYLKEYGYNVIHDTTYHDYPAYTGSYNRSLTTVENLLKTTNSDVIIDLHRDAIGSNSNYAPTVKIGEDYAAQLMYVVGTNGGGLWHPNWNNNLKFAIKIQQKANELYPGLFKPIILRNSRYNQHLGKAAGIIEVGATGNTLEQCLTSMKYLSKVISEVMK